MHISDAIIAYKQAILWIQEIHRLTLLGWHLIACLEWMTEEKIQNIDSGWVPFSSDVIFPQGERFFRKRPGHGNWN